MTIVSPDKIQSGDQVLMNGEVLMVKNIDGPDTNGTFDFYLTNGSKDLHKIVADPIILIG